MYIIFVSVFSIKIFFLNKNFLIIFVKKLQIIQKSITYRKTIFENKLIKIRLTVRNHTILKKLYLPLFS